MAKLSIKKFATQDAASVHYQREVDVQAEEARGRITTMYPGQAVTYEAKAKEALQYPDGVSFPWLEGEAQELGMSVADVAQAILSARKQWEQAGVAIERKRLGAKAAIRRAASAEAMHRIVDALDF